MLRVILLGMLVLLAGCGDEDPAPIAPDELTPPLGLAGVNGDGAVTLSWWCHNTDSDLLGFKIMGAAGDYAGEALAEVPHAFAVFDSLAVSAPHSGELSHRIAGLENGVTYSFLVVSVERHWENASTTSNVIAVTPRADSAARELLIFAREVNPIQAGFDLRTFTVVDCTHLDDYATPDGRGDVICGRFDTGSGVRLWLNGINGAQIQDLGYMAYWEAAREAPRDGNGYAETGEPLPALPGHVFAVRTADQHYGKIQVLGQFAVDYLIIKAAYQPQAGNREYK